MENSWGEKDGNKGQFALSEAFFQNYVYEVAVHLPTLQQFCRKNGFFLASQMQQFAPTNNKATSSDKASSLYTALFAQGLTTEPITIDLLSPSFGFLHR